MTAAGPEHAERTWDMATVLQRKFVDDEPCIYFDEKLWYNFDRSEVRRNRGGLWQRGGYKSYTADDEWETLEGSESQRLEAEYQRLVKSGEVEDIDAFLDRPRWIPVSERLPDRRWDGFSDIVVVAAGNAFFLGRYYRSDTAENCSRCGASTGELWYIGTTAEPTHWMELPEPPEVK